VAGLKDGIRCGGIPVFKQAGREERAPRDGYDEDNYGEDRKQHGVSDTTVYGVKSLGLFLNPDTFYINIRAELVASEYAPIAR
jgi:hypothetical protein